MVDGGGANGGGETPKTYILSIRIQTAHLNICDVMVWLFIFQDFTKHTELRSSTN